MREATFVISKIRKRIQSINEELLYHEKNTVEAKTLTNIIWTLYCNYQHYKVVCLI